MSRTVDLFARLRAGDVLLADGATGTMLQDGPIPCGRMPEACVFEQPDQVRSLHRDYLDAGSDLLLTNTFGGTRYRLEADGLSGQVFELNRRAAELAREVAGGTAWVVGDMGPTGQLFAPFGRLTAEDAASAYAEQAAGLVAGGADLLLIETMSDLAEARAAIDGTRRVTDLPLFCTFSFDTHRRTMMGVRPAQVAEEIGPLVAGFGANCGRDPAEFAGIVATMRRSSPEALLWAKPNAGLPRVVGNGQVVYDATPEYMAMIAVGLREAGAQIIGGCCGTTPEHLAAMASALRAHERARPLRGWAARRISSLIVMEAL